MLYNKNARVNWYIAVGINNIDMTDYILNNTIIFDGNKEYSKQEIESDEELKHMRNGFLVFKGLVSLFEDVEEDGGQIYITTDQNLKNQMVDLRNVSNETKNKFQELNI